jgi:hypothetical protein
MNDDDVLELDIQKSLVSLKVYCSPLLMVFGGAINTF